MRKPQVFISHSSLGDPGVSADLKAIEQRLARGRKVGVLLDKKGLKGGERWRDRIHLWMRYCDAAIILLTPKALESEWVLQEATILASRRLLAKGSEFILIPVLIGTDRKTVEATNGFRPLALFETQPVKDLRGAALAKRLEEQLQPVIDRGTPTSRGHLKDAVAQHLKLKSKRLEDIAEMLGSALDDWEPNRELDERVAMLLVDAPFDQAMAVLTNMSGDLTTEPTSRLAELLMGGWVAPVCAARFQQVASGPAGSRAIAVNGRKHDFTPKSIASRASDSPTLWSPITTSDVTGDDLLSGLIRQVREALLQQVENDPALIRDYVAQVVRTRPLVVALPPFEPPPDAAVIDGLLTEFPEITFIIMTGTRMPPDGQLVRATRLQPELGENEETRAFLAYRDMRQAVGLR